MKFFLSLLAMLIVVHFSYAQNTNPWPSTGNVGIGTTSPLSGGGAASWLTLNGTSAYSGGTVYAISGVAKGFSYIAPDGLLTQEAEASAGQKFVVDGTTTAMTILSSGNVAIGTDDPQGYKLAVNGSAIATSMTVKLHSNWPDYVFKPQYHLPALTDVKTYINQNQHLPGIPSEQEVAKNGLDLGEMNKILTQKIEELTLYLIEKDKQLNDQTQQIKNQEERLKALEKTMGKLVQ